MSEKRGFTRYSIEGDITLKTEGDEPVVLKVAVTDISFLGVSIYYSEKLDDIIGKELRFELNIELLTQPLTGKGRIKYITEEKKGDGSVFRMGLEFLDVDKKILSNFLSVAQEKFAMRRSRARPFSRPGQHFGAY